MSCISRTGIETQTGFQRRKYRIEKVTSGHTMCTVHMRSVYSHPEVFFFPQMILCLSYIVVITDLSVLKADYFISQSTHSVRCTDQGRT